MGPNDDVLQIKIEEWIGSRGKHDDELEMAFGKSTISVLDIGSGDVAFDDPVLASKIVSRPENLFSNHDPDKITTGALHFASKHQDFLRSNTGRRPIMSKSLKIVDPRFAMGFTGGKLDYKMEDIISNWFDTSYNLKKLNNHAVDVIFDGRKYFYTKGYWAWKYGIDDKLGREAVAHAWILRQRNILKRLSTGGRLNKLWDMKDMKTFIDANPRRP